MEGQQKNIISARRDSDALNTSEMQGQEEKLSPEMLQRYLKGLKSCKKQRHRACLSQEIYKLISS